MPPEALGRPPLALDSSRCTSWLRSPATPNNAAGLLAVAGSPRNLWDRSEVRPNPVTPPSRPSRRRSGIYSAPCRQRMDGLGSDDAPARDGADRRLHARKGVALKRKGILALAIALAGLLTIGVGVAFAAHKYSTKIVFLGNSGTRVQPQRPDLLRGPELQLEVPGRAQGRPLQRDERPGLQADRRRPEQLQRCLRSASGDQRRAESRDRGGEGQAEQQEGRLQVRDALARAGASGLVQGRLAARPRGWESFL